MESMRFKHEVLNWTEGKFFTSVTVEFLSTHIYSIFVKVSWKYSAVSMWVWWCVDRKSPDVFSSCHVHQQQLAASWPFKLNTDHFLSCDLATVMEVASGEYGDQIFRLVKAVQKDEQAEPNGDAKLHPLLWQCTDEVNIKLKLNQSTWSILTEDT